MVGHHAIQDKQIKQKIFPDGYDGLEMSWFVTNVYAFGGRKGLSQFIKYVLFGKKQHGHKRNHFDVDACATDCNTINGVFIRPFSILTNSKTQDHTLNKATSKNKTYSQYKLLFDAYKDVFFF